MSYFQIQELNQYVEREILPGLAEDCVTEFYERFNVLLDVSPASLARIDSVLQTPTSLLETEAMVGPIGAYLGAVFCKSDGARWVAAFDCGNGMDGYTASRLWLYKDKIDIFSLVRQVLSGSQSLVEVFHHLHRPLAHAA